jgi:hypothetical protein
MFALCLPSELAPFVYNAFRVIGWEDDVFVGWDAVSRTLTFRPT